MSYHLFEKREYLYQRNHKVILVKLDPFIHFSPKDSIFCPGVCFPINGQVTFTGKGVNIYLANQWTVNGLYDNLISYLEMLSVCDLESE